MTDPTTPAPLTDEEELFLAETWDQRWMTRPAEECRAALRRLLDAARSDRPEVLNSGHQLEAEQRGLPIPFAPCTCNGFPPHQHDRPEVGEGLQRWSMDADQTSAYMELDPDGEWVKWEDVAALRAEPAPALDEEAASLVGHFIAMHDEPDRDRAIWCDGQCKLAREMRALADRLGTP